MEENVLILGAASDMAVAIAKKYSSVGYSVTLAGRSVDKLRAIESDLKVRFNGTVHSVFFDALNFTSHESFYQNLPEKPDVVICVFGLLGDQFEAQKDWKACEQILY